MIQLNFLAYGSLAQLLVKPPHYRLAALPILPVLTLIPIIGASQAMIAIVFSSTTMLEPQLAVTDHWRLDAGAFLQVRPAQLVAAPTTQGSTTLRSLSRCDHAASTRVINPYYTALNTALYICIYCLVGRPAAHIYRPSYMCVTLSYADHSL